MSNTAMYKNVLRGAAAAGFAGALMFGVSGCKSNAPAPIVSGVNGQDPADANLAQPYTGGNAGGYTTTGSNGGTQVMGQSQAYQPQASGEAYYDQQNAAPIIRQYPNGAAPQGQAYDGGYADAEEAGEEAIAATDQAPPPLPEYDQPPAPDSNDIWTPGYWNYGSEGYYWVPGVWVAPPYYGALWTPPWWGSYGGHWRFHRGYWGPHVGYYGGINYGFGYIGLGYFGGYWHGHDFVYNRAVSNIDPGRIHTFYNRPVVYNGVNYGPHSSDRVSYNGGRGGINVQPRPSELAALREPHYAPMPAQREIRVAAGSNRAQAFTANGGRPAEAFANHAVGSRSNIAEAPREQPFNHPGAVGPAARPGAPEAGGRGFAAGNPAVNPGARPGFEAGRPGNPENRPGFDAGRNNNLNARPGFTPGNPAVNPGARPGFEAGRPATPENRPGFEAGRNGNPTARPGFDAGRPGTPENRPGTPQPVNPGARPGFEAGRPVNNAVHPGIETGRPGNPGGRPGYEAGHPGTAPQPTGQPGVANQRPGFAGRPAQPVAQPPQQMHAAPAERPAFNRPQPAPRPEPAFHPAPAPAPAFHPAPEPRAAPAPAFHPAPAPAPRPAPAPAARPAPAPQPHGGEPHGGENDKHH